MKIVKRIYVSEVTDHGGNGARFAVMIRTMGNTMSTSQESQNRILADEETCAKIGLPISPDLVGTNGWCTVEEVGSPEDNKFDKAQLISAHYTENTEFRRGDKGQTTHQLFLAKFYGGWPSDTRPSSRIDLTLPLEEQEYRKALARSPLPVFKIGFQLDN